MPIKIFTDEIKEFICNNIKNKQMDELTEIVNNKFNTNYTVNQIKAFKCRQGLTSGAKPKKTGCKIFSTEVIEYINNNVTKMTLKELVKSVNDTFGTMHTYQQLKSYKHRYNVKRGINYRYEKGHIPHNKGKKGVCGKNCEKTWFKKGHKPVNYKPIGSEKLSTDGYVFVKTSNKTWVQKHRLEWEQHNGAIPKGKVIVFLDGDRRNTDINNLILVTRAELQALNGNSLICNNAEVSKTGVALAKLMVARNKKIKEIKEREKSK